MIHLKRALFKCHMFKPKKALEEKKGQNPIEIQADIKIKKFKRQSNYTNPDAWARLIGRNNTAPIYLEGTSGYWSFRYRLSAFHDQ